MPIVGAQLLGQQLGTPQAYRIALDIHQQRRAFCRRQGRPVTQAAIGQYQQALALRRFQALAAIQPGGGLLQGIKQGRTTASTQLSQPLTQFAGGLLPLPQPLPVTATGLQQGQTRALAVGLVEYFGEQALGLAEGAMTAGRGRGVDYHQPQFILPGATRATGQILATARAAF